MIQFMEVNKDGDEEFGFYDTIFDKILEFNETQLWDNVEDFIEDFEEEKKKWTTWKLDLERFTNKISLKFKQ